MKHLLAFFLLGSFLSADEIWHLELKNGTIFSLNERPQKLNANYGFKVSGKDIEVPAKSVASLTVTKSAIEKFLYTESSGEVFSAKEMNQTVVRVTSLLNKGSGTLIHSDGYILTNNATIKNDYDLKVTLHDGSKFKVSVVAKSDLFDLAILKIDEPESRVFPYARFGDERPLKGDAEVYTFSTAGDQSWEKKDTKLVNAIEYFGQEDGLVYQQYEIQMRPDNMGSPLFDGKGNLIGIVTQKIESAHFQHVWFSTPISFVKIIMKNLNGFVTQPSGNPMRYRNIEKP